jgi:hypothetical protein
MSRGYAANQWHSHKKFKSKPHGLAQPNRTALAAKPLKQNFGVNFN